MHASGRWVRLQKNPNEYDDEELVRELKKLPEDKRKEVVMHPIYRSI